jgi:hypothetical protein
MKIVRMRKSKIVQKISLLFLLLICFQSKSQCEKIKRGEKDGNMLYFTSNLRKLQLIKHIIKKDTIYYLKIKVTHDYLANRIKGGKVILGSDKIINFPKAEIDIEKNDTYENGRYLYTSLVKIKKLDVVHIMAFGVLGFELYVFKDDIEDTEQFSNEILCLLQSH